MRLYLALLSRALSHGMYPRSPAAIVIDLGTGRDN